MLRVEICAGRLHVGDNSRPKSPHDYIFALLEDSVIGVFLNTV